MQLIFPYNKILYTSTVQGLVLALGFWLAPGLVRAATVDGSLKMEVITAYNFVVDSNVESPSSVSPSAAHLGVKFTNTGATPLTNLRISIGTLTNAATSSGTPSVFPSRTVAEATYGGTFRLQLPGGAVDAVRDIPTLAPGQSLVQYFFVTYPLKDGSGKSVTGAANVTADDLWLNYDIWASALEGATTRRVDQRSKVTMRNEISAMANKIEPNTTAAVPDEYLNAIQAALGWRPSTATPRVPGAIVKEGIWYNLGNVGAGFDNNGDGVPDRNAWMQPVGMPGSYDSTALRLIKCYGIVIVKLNDGTEQLIPFEDRLYFENLPGNNTGAVGLVFYEYLPITPGRSVIPYPYQEVASGYDNEKFNGDFGAGAGAFSTPPVSLSQTPSHPVPAPRLGPTRRAPLKSNFLADGLAVAVGYYSAFGDDNDSSGLKVRAQLDLGRNIYLGAEWRQNGDLTNQEWRFDAGARFAIGRNDSAAPRGSAYALPRETGRAASQAEVAYAPAAQSGGKAAFNVNPVLSGKSGKSPLPVQPLALPPPPAMLANPALYAPIRRTPWPMTSLRHSMSTSESYSSERRSFSHTSTDPNCKCGPTLNFD